MQRLTEEEIEAGKSPRGGFTRAQLARWGVGWPPPAGWRRALVAGKPIPRQTIQHAKPKAIRQPSPIRPDVDAHDLLRQVVVAVINAGHASDLYEFPDVLRYFGAAGRQREVST